MIIDDNSLRSFLGLHPDDKVNASVIRDFLYSKSIGIAARELILADFLLHSVTKDR